VFGRRHAVSERRHAAFGGRHAVFGRRHAVSGRGNAAFWHRHAASLTPTGCVGAPTRPVSVQTRCVRTPTRCVQARTCLVRRGHAVFQVSAVRSVPIATKSRAEARVPARSRQVADPNKRFPTAPSRTARSRHFPVLGTQIPCVLAAQYESASDPTIHSLGCLRCLGRNDLKSFSNRLVIRTIPREPLQECGDR